MWAQSLGPPEQQMGSSRLRVVHVLYEDYRDLYDAIFDEPLPPQLDPTHPESDRFPPEGGPTKPTASPGWQDMTPEDRETVNRIYTNFGKALAAYQRRLISGNSPFDQYVRDEDYDAISESAKRGLRLFIGEARCGECHAGPAFTDNNFYNIGVPLSDNSFGRYEAISAVLDDEFNTESPYSDDQNFGRMLLGGLQPTEEDIGKFRTKHLRQIEGTGRYMHAGQFLTLRDVVDFYADGGPGERAPVGTLDERIEPLGLSSQDRDDLVAFLETLTGDPISPDLIEPYE
jgi:cytochrome c peroxidase